MKLFFTLFWILLLSTVSIAQIKTNKTTDELVGNKEIVTQSRSLGSFSRLTVDYAIKVRITEGDPAQAQLEGESNVLPLIVTETANDELRIGFPRTINVKNTGPVTVTIHRSGLAGVRLRTACRLTSELPIEANELAIDLDTASFMSAPIQASKLTLNLRLSSKADLSGQVDEGVVSLSGTSRLMGESLTIKRATVKVEQVSNATLSVVETLAATADNHSTIRYKGTPALMGPNVSTVQRIK